MWAAIHHWLIVLSQHASRPARHFGTTFASTIMLVTTFAAVDDTQLLANGFMDYLFSYVLSILFIVIL